jgi:hypothetical protein
MSRDQVRINYRTNRQTLMVLIHEFEKKLKSQAQEIEDYERPIRAIINAVENNE